MLRKLKFLFTYSFKNETLFLLRVKNSNHAVIIVINIVKNVLDEAKIGIIVNSVYK